jgi:ComF family protein
MRGMWLCDLCEAETLTLGFPGSCGRCGELPYRGRCGCADLPADIDMARAYAVYEGWTSAAVKRLKYDREPDRASHLAAYLTSMLADFGHIDGLVPVPLHPTRERDRGFNQARLLAQHLSRSTGIPVADMIRRTRKTVSQTTLSGRQRRENVRDVFAIDPFWHPRPGRRLVLIDDVRTTGATLGACAQAITAVTPARIGVLTVALDMQREELDAYREEFERVRAGSSSSP